ncbi:carnosine N-methyltransferase-like, partial [Orbicella faveolata]|uniref:carnosine N-methyltransferase-like n=1 Tax=Orbicella faveolata TaxID=48498 RepID=UPI0009E58368
FPLIKVPNDPASQPISGFDMEKVTTTLKQFVRDWSDEGKAERDACYKPIIEEIERLFPGTDCSKKDVSILVPGAGLARLMFDIAKLGYKCQGNEWSLYMLFASHFILNRAPGKYHTTIYPYIHQTCNNRKSEDQVRSVVIPDVDPTDVPPDLNFSMAAGDFLEVYTEEGTVSLSMYLILAKGLLRIAPHEVARSITTPGRGGEGGGVRKRVQAHSRFPLPLS